MNGDPHLLPPRIDATIAREAGNTRAMRILIVSDAWSPQINGVVITLRNTIRELELQGHTVATITPDGFNSIPCPTYPEIRLALIPGRRVARSIEAFSPDAIHVATEGPLGSRRSPPLPAHETAVLHGLPHAVSRICPRAHSPSIGRSHIAGCAGSMRPPAH